MVERLRRAGVAKMNAWRADWNLFASEALGVNLDREQRDILAAVQHEPRVSVVSGTSRGKDFVAAVAAMCFLYLTPRWRGRELVENTKVFLTAPTDRQVRNIMMPEISRLFNRARQRVDLPGRINSDSIRTGHDEWFLNGFKADANNHEAWTGLHAVNIMFVITEASGIGENIFEAIEGNLQGNSRLLLVFNPNRSVGYAAQSQKSERWARFRLNSLTAPNVTERRNVIAGQVDYAWVLDKVKIWCNPIRAEEVKAELDDFEFEGRWYRPDDLFRKKVLGMFPRVDDDVLIPPQWLTIAHRRWEEANGYKPQQAAERSILGVDVAGMGRDSSCLVERSGSWVSEFDMHNSGGEADHMAIVGRIADRLKRDASMAVSIDTIGEGAGVYSRAVELFGKQRIVSCKYSESAKGSNGRDLTDVTGQHHFANMRAYLFWAVRDWLDPKNATDAMLPPSDQLDEEATEIRWQFRSDGRILIEPKDDIKKRLGRSTDRFDALANTFYPIRGRRRQLNLKELYGQMY